MAYFAALPQLTVPATLAHLVPPEVVAARDYYRAAYAQHEISLYVHYPFCVRKCPYCDFSSLPLGSDGARDEDYVSLLLREFELKKDLLKGRSLVSVYLGGGTPSLCEPKELGRLLAGIGPYLAADAEISLEANPGTVDAHKLRQLRAAGFNRISIGVQSFDEVMLKRLGRIHSRDEAIAAARLARAAGFTNFNLDVMHGLPGQDVAGALADLDTALSLEPTHLSWYELTLEEGTYFGKHPPKLPDEDVLVEIETAGFAKLQAAGFAHYEVSAFSLGGTTRCYHNQNYWLYGDYLGLGAGAHQKVSLKRADAAALSGMALSGAAALSGMALSGMALSGQSGAEVASAMAIWRTANSEEIAAYRDQLLDLNVARKPPLLLGCSSHEVTDLGEIIFEYLLNRLRLRSDPVSVSEFKLRTGRELTAFTADFLLLQEQGLVACELDSDGVLRAFTLTEQGNLMLNDVLAHFL